MRVIRAIFNRALAGLSTDNKIYQEIDKKCLTIISEIGRRFHIGVAQRADKPWVFNSIRILAESVVHTPYGEELQFCWPMLASVEVTQSCPFSCSVCYSNSKPASSVNGIVSLDVIRKLASSPIPCILLTGGEPISHPQIQEIVATLVENGKAIYVATASSPNALAPIIKSHPFDLTILSSVWGDCVSHDRIRGAGAYARLESQLGALDDDLPAACWLNVVITPPDLTAFRAYIDLAQRHTFDRVFITRQLDFGRYERHILNSGRLITDLLELSSSLPYALRRKTFLALPEASLHVKPDPIREMLLKFLGIKLPQLCGSGAWLVHIRSDGQISQCFGLDPSGPTDWNIDFQDQWFRIRDNKMFAHAASCAAEMSQDSLARY